MPRYTTAKFTSSTANATGGEAEPAAENQRIRSSIGLYGDVVYHED